MTGKDEKNWLIRTKNFQILGPVSKKKIIEFVEKGSLKEDDEISRGNGYWFAIGERDLLDKYIYGDVPQEFNPISEAPTVLATEENLGHTASFGGGGIGHATKQAEEHSQQDALSELPDQDDDGQKLPGGDDLDYPDFGDDITVVSQSNNLAEQLEEENQKEASGPPPVQWDFDDSPPNEGDGLVPSQSDLEYPDLPSSGGGLSESSTPLKNAPIKKQEEPRESSTEVLQEGDEEILVPGGEDLEYPDLDGGGGEEPPASLPEDIQQSDSEESSGSSLELSTKKETPKATPKKPTQSQAVSPRPKKESSPKNSSQAGADITASDELDEVDINLPPADDTSEKDSENDTAPDVSQKQSKKKSKPKKSKPAQKEKNDRYLIYLFALLALLVAGIVYYYLKILNKPLPLVGAAHAQTIESVGKKKV